MPTIPATPERQTLHPDKSLPNTCNASIEMPRGSKFVARLQRVDQHEEDLVMSDRSFEHTFDPETPNEDFNGSQDLAADFFRFSDVDDSDDDFDDGDPAPTTTYPRQESEMLGDGSRPETSCDPDEYPSELGTAGDGKDVFTQAHELSLTKTRSPPAAGSAQQNPDINGAENTTSAIDSPERAPSSSLTSIENAAPSCSVSNQPSYNTSLIGPNITCRKHAAAWKKLNIQHPETIEQWKFMLEDRKMLCDDLVHFLTYSLECPSIVDVAAKSMCYFDSISDTARFEETKRHVYPCMASVFDQLPGPMTFTASRVVCRTFAVYSILLAEKTKDIIDLVLDEKDAVSDKSVKEVEKVKADEKDKADGMSKIMEVRSGMGMSKRVRRSWLIADYHSARKRKISNLTESIQTLPALENSTKAELPNISASVKRVRKDHLLISESSRVNLNSTETYVSTVLAGKPESVDDGNFALILDSKNATLKRMKEGRAAIEREVDEVVRQVKDAQELELVEDIQGPMRDIERAAESYNAFLAAARTPKGEDKSVKGDDNEDVRVMDVIEDRRVRQGPAKTRL
ncbi:hypothetical protein BKA61DRAFT_574330 [Leptodontidium sp. MPI-SDFR-AT-0119]|nr:hypothetical protein BKA61DRAFT_574330 [Leptodontidium sp. MPI-SDFR-AT-0119]